MEGRVISGRYAVQEVVGKGGMAIVYRAYDQLTHQTVAIKVLRKEYEEDEEFVRRFSNEAEAASKVSHENIVNMLAVGTDGNLRYIVMEFVDGRTLKDMIREDGPISQEQAIPMIIRILAAVDHAHRNGIVHRDIKPQNILVDKQGRVKVADFGIARLKAAQTSQIDEKTGKAAIGSVHYFSPEQAQGEQADEKSDLYSVGVVMYEMLTGVVPFDGDSTYAVMLKHVHESPRSLRYHNVTISKALDEIMMRALCKDASKRYQSAAEMAADLREAIAHPKGGFVRYPQTLEEIEQEKREQELREQRRRRRLRIAAAAITLAALASAIGIGVWYVTKIMNTYVMPGLVGKDEYAAEALLSQKSAHVSMAYTYSDEVEKGMVISQSVQAGERVKRDNLVTLTISQGSQWYELPDCVGGEIASALEALEAMDVVSVSVQYIRSDSPVGTVVSQSLDAGTQARDEPLTLTVSGQRILMPDLSGMTLDNARALIEAEGLTLGVVGEGSVADAKPLTVIAQSVTEGIETLAGTEVDLTLNQAQTQLYYPESKLSVVVPLDDTSVRIMIETPGGESKEAYQGQLNKGTYRVALSSLEAGTHIIDIFMDDIRMERQSILFE